MHRTTSGKYLLAEIVSSEKTIKEVSYMPKLQ
jgi:hypothetical protein